MFRVTKLLKIGKYKGQIFRLIDRYLQLKPTEARVIVVVSFFMFLVHIFACIFYLIARVKDFDSNTWVGNNGFLTVDHKEFLSWAYVMYWAF